MPLRPSTMTARRWPCGAALLLLAAAALAPGPARAADFTDAAGRHVVLPDRPGRILPAERNAEVLVFALAPNKLAAIGRPEGGRSARSREARRPVIEWRLRTTPAEMAQVARQVRADLIIDAGTVTPDRASFADQVQQQTGVPYILVDDTFARIPAMLRSIGVILGVGDRGAELASYAEQALIGLRGRLLIRPADARPHVYYGRGPDGLTTPLPGSPAGETIDAAGAINVAAPLGRGTQVTITREQLLGWDPPIIIAENRGFYDALHRSPGWRRLTAVRTKHVYLEPGRPFGWMDDPNGINRVIGLHWLSDLFYPDVLQEDLRATTCEFYQKFYRIKLTNGEVEAMVKPAGGRPAETTFGPGEPLVGLGVEPRVPAPSATPGEAQTAVPGAAAAAGVPESGPRATCALPGGLSPLGIVQSATEPQLPAPDVTGAAPAGVPPPGRRGHPTP